MATSDCTQVKAFIKLCQYMGNTPSETVNLIKTTSMKEYGSRTLVFDWHKRFAEGQYSLTDNKSRRKKQKYGATLLAAFHR